MYIRPRMEKSHSCWPRTAWCVVNMFHKNGMRPLIIANNTICYSILYCNSPTPHIRLKYMYSVISVKLDWLPGNSKSGQSTSSWRLECDFSILGRIYVHIHTYKALRINVYVCICVSIHVHTHKALRTRQRHWLVFSAHMYVYVYI